MRRALGSYAERGVFRSFSEIAAPAPHARFRFLWFRDVAFIVDYNPRTRTMVFVDLLPAVPPKSDMDRDLRLFIRGRSDKALPEHRRVDPRKVTVVCKNRGGRVSVSMTFGARHVEYGVKKAINLVHEILMDFLNDDRFTRYQVEHFNLNPELA